MADTRSKEALRQEIADLERNHAAVQQNWSSLVEQLRREVAAASRDLYEARKELLALQSKHVQLIKVVDEVCGRLDYHDRDRSTAHELRDALSRIEGKTY